MNFVNYILSCCLLCLPVARLFAQDVAVRPEKYQTAYEQEILQKNNPTHLELLMAMGPEASPERTLAVKKELDAFVSELKSSKLLAMPEVKLIKELHKKVHSRFLTEYQYISPFSNIFQSGKYNCVSATALFALVLEELDIPYAIQEQPTHVYIMAYPDTKAISVEMTAVNNAYYLPARKDVSGAVNMLLDLGLTTQEEITVRGVQQVYNAFYNTNDVIDLKQLAGIQYWNEAIVAVNEQNYPVAFDAICKTDRLYNEKKIQLFRTEVLLRLLDEAKFDCMQDIRYLVEYANVKNANQTKVYFQYASFLHEQLITNRKRELADSTQVYISAQITDPSQAKKLKGLYYLAVSEYFANAYNLKKQLEYAEMAYVETPEDPKVELYLIRSLIASLEKYDAETALTKMDEYAKNYPFLLQHNLCLATYFYIYTDISNAAYSGNDGSTGKKYFDMAIKTRQAMEDTEVLNEEQVGWLYAEAGAYLARQREYEAALKLLEEGLELAPGHERIVARIEIVKSRMK